MPESESGDVASSGRRVLIVVSSRHGATTEIADVIAAEMAALGVAATVAEPDDHPDLSSFDGVIVGSAVYVGRWLKPARRFVRARVAELASTHVWLFSCGPLGEDHEPGLDPDHVRWLTTSVGAREHREFGGRLDGGDLGPIESLVVRAVDAPTGDFRDWAEIREWGREIARVVAAE